MRYILKSLAVGPMAANCYILGCERTHGAAIIDPGADEKAIERQIAVLGLEPKMIINTHGHVDHIGANSKLGLPVYIHKADAGQLTDPVKNVSASIGMPLKSPPAAKLLQDGDRIDIGDIDIEVIHTPGHTPGSICLKFRDIVFTGDTLFAEGVGRTDFPGGSEPELLKSIQEKLFVLPDSTKVYPGHGPATTIGHEKRKNPFF